DCLLSWPSRRRRRNRAAQCASSTETSDDRGRRCDPHCLPPSCRVERRRGERGQSRDPYPQLGQRPCRENTDEFRLRLLAGGPSGPHGRSAGGQVLRSRQHITPQRNCKGNHHDEIPSASCAHRLRSLEPQPRRHWPAQDGEKFGGAERLRISSQALKRAIRTSANFRERLAGNLGERTQRLGDVINAHLKKSGVEDAKALEITRIVAGVFGKIEDKDKPQTYIKQLAFISPEERIAAIDLADRLVAEGADSVKKEELAGKLLRRADTAADIAMFGRMLADNPDYNREAAVQVAHAITTHKVVVEDDFYTAVDDLKTSAEDAGAGFIGELGFGSGVFYLYACIDRELLVKNLGGDAALARKAM